METDIDGSATPEVQPTRPPRRQLPPPESPSSPPELPPKTFSSSQEINHNEHKSKTYNQTTPLSGTSVSNHLIRPYNDRKSHGGVEANKPSPTIHRRTIMPLASESGGKASPPIQRRHTERPADRVHTALPVDTTPVVFEVERVDSHLLTATPVTMRPQPTDRRERRAESMRSPVVTEDLTVISGDASAERKHLVRRTSFGKQSKRRSVSNASSHSREEKISVSSNNGDSSNGKPSPSGRLPHQRETEFSATEVSIPSPAERLDASSINSAIHENKPRLFDRYNPSSYHTTSPTQPGSGSISASHSRSVSAELLDIASRTESPGGRHHHSTDSLNSPSGSRAPSRDGVDTPANRHKFSPLPAPRSPKQSTSGSRSERQSLGR